MGESRLPHWRSLEEWCFGERDSGLGGQHKNLALLREPKSRGLGNAKGEFLSLPLACHFAFSFNGEVVARDLTQFQF